MKEESVSIEDDPFDLALLRLLRDLRTHLLGRLDVARRSTAQRARRDRRDGLSVDVDQLWGVFRHWCDDQGRFTTTKSTFGRDLRSALPGIRKARPRHEGDRVARYEGISLKNTPSGHSGHGWS